MDKLNYEILDSLYDSAHGYLEVTDVDVKRLRDDRSEIQPGDEVAFVATASFRLTHSGVEQLKNFPTTSTTGPGVSAYEHLAVGDELLVIGPDAEVRCDKLPIDEDSVTRWLADRYDFTFLLNGAAHGPFRPVGHVRIAADRVDSVAAEQANQVAVVRAKSHARELALPWIRKLNTAAVKDDYIDVDVRINEKPGTSQSKPGLSRTVWRLANATATVDGDKSHSVVAYLEVDSPSLSVGKLIKQRFRLPVQSEDGELRFSLTFDTVQDQMPQSLHAGPAHAGTMTKTTKHKP